MAKITESKVFIIESLDFDDEQHDRFEGRFLSQILHLGEKESAYFYVQTKEEFSKALRLFGKSKYRYLHISCHGNSSSISTTLDPIPFPTLGKMIKPYMKDKRLFLSACSAVNSDIARNVIPTSECLSIIGPCKRIPFDDAAIIWASFYYLVFKEDYDRMNRDAIVKALKKVAKTFEIPLNYFSISEDFGFKGDRIDTSGKLSRIYPII
jgi:hypothetical protein